MPDYSKYRNQNYNPLGTAEPEDLAIQTDSQGFHEIKVYNGVRDRMWELFSNLVLSNSQVEVIAFAEQIQVVLLRADSVWKGIQTSANMKASGLGIGKTKEFEYHGEMKDEAKKVKRYVDFYQNYGQFIDQFGKPDGEFSEFMNNTEAGKLQYLKGKLEDIVTTVDNKWGELASKIGMGIPLKIAEEKELFFRDHRSLANKIHKG